MTQQKFKIPAEFADQLRYVKTRDNRTDAEILQSLKQPPPVTSEKNIWAFWDKGLEVAPSWTHRNICDWVRICSSGTKPWTVRVLDARPDSDNYALKFAPAELLPETFIQGTMKGPYIGQHSADFLRGALLYTHGGVFMDVGSMLFRHLDHVGWNELEDPTSPYQISISVFYRQVTGNHFVMARKGDPFIKRWHDLFTYLWRGRDSHKGISQDALLAFTHKMNFDDSRASGFHWQWKIEPTEAFEYVAQVMAWLRLTQVEGSEADPFNGSEYWQRHVLVFPALHECWAAEHMIGFNGADIYAALNTRLDADAESEEYKKAYRLVWRLLTQSSFQKITHGKGLTHDAHLGTLWDENEGKDIEPGTFAELLRYGCSHFEQARTSIRRLPAEPALDAFKKGVFEP